MAKVTVWSGTSDGSCFLLMDLWIQRRIFLLLVRVNNLRKYLTVWRDKNVDKFPCP